MTALTELYREIKKKARGCRDRDIRIKLELFLLADKLGNVSEACYRRGFSRRFYYRWWKRFKKSKYDLKSLIEKPRRPKNSPHQISWKLEKTILFLKRKHFGARMIEALLIRQGVKVSRSTICHVLRRRRNRPLKKRERLKTHRKRYELPIPGQRLQMDVKYVPYLVEGKKAYMYVAIDECTRWRYMNVYDQINEGITVKFLDELLEACPFPIHTIQTDNGQEFSYKLNPVARHIKHRMDIWCASKGIAHQLIPPGVKELNGKVERSHRIDEQYFYWKAPSDTWKNFKITLGHWLSTYHKRPHGGLEFKTPLEKLLERQETLKTIQFENNIENIRLKFLEGKPNVLSKLDWQILELENELRMLLKVA
jgi:transposase InsO family protein